MNNKLLEKAETIINNLSKEQLISLLLKHGVEFSEITELEDNSNSQIPPPPEPPPPRLITEGVKIHINEDNNLKYKRWWHVI